MPNDEQLDPVEQVFLHAYPNPTRTGCPGEAVLRAIARKQVPVGDPAREHLARCSPCYADFKRIQREYQRTRILFRTVGTIAAVLVVGVVSWAWLLREPAGDRTGRSGGTAVGKFPPKAPPTAPPQEPASPNPETIVAVLNLEGLSTTRGVKERPVRPELQRLPRKSRIELSIYLPLGSDEGFYEVRLLRHVSQLDQPVRAYQGTATIRSGLTVLPITADLSALESGTYVLAFRRTKESWRFGRVALD